MIDNSKLDPVRNAHAGIRGHLDKHDERLSALYACGTATASTGDTLTLTFRFPVHARLVDRQAADVLNAVRKITGISFANLVTEVSREYRTSRP